MGPLHRLTLPWLQCRGGSCGGLGPKGGAHSTRWVSFPQKPTMQKPQFERLTGSWEAGAEDTAPSPREGSAADSVPRLVLGCQWLN